MKKILVTAFAPFGGRKTNISAIVMKSLPSSINGFKIIKEIIPVSGLEAGVRMRELLAKHKPVRTLSFGLAAGETAVRAERFALNIKDYGINDNSGLRPAGIPIHEDGPAAYYLSFHPEKIVSLLLKAKIPAYASSHAGTYVCNTLMYEAMHAISGGICGNDCRYAFVHLPLSSEEAIKEKPYRFTATLPQEMLKKAGFIILNAMAE